MEQRERTYKKRKEGEEEGRNPRFLFDLKDTIGFLPAVKEEIKLFDQANNIMISVIINTLTGGDKGSISSLQHHM